MVAANTTNYAERFEVSLPSWTAEVLQETPTHIVSLEARMQLVNQLALKNITEETGGPFAAAVFEKDTGKLVSVGVNRVMPLQCSSLHAEVVCLSLAQQALSHFDLGATNFPLHQLVVNWLPCAMCFGATLWSGIRSLVIAGASHELESITGFDEGPIHPDWRSELQKRDVELIENVGKEEAIKVFKAFADSGQFVYNARQSCL